MTSLAERSISKRLGREKRRDRKGAGDVSEGVFLGGSPLLWFYHRGLSQELLRQGTGSLFVGAGGKGKSLFSGSHPQRSKAD